MGINMTKEVLVSVAGLQLNIDQDEVVEVISRGEYYFRNDKHYIIYDEFIEDESGNGSGSLTQCILKLNKSKAELIRKGESQTNLIFEVGKSSQTFYHTPYGDLMLGVNTTAIELKESEDQISARLLYSLDINYQYVSDCELKIEIRGNFSEA